MTAAERHTAMATAPHTEAPLLTAALAPRLGLPAPKPPHTTASATAPRLPHMALAAAATPGDPRHPPTASQPRHPVPAAPTAGATRLVRAAALTCTTLPPQAPVWVRLPLRPSVLPLLVPTLRLPRLPSAPRRRVPGRAVGAPMPRLPPLWARQPQRRAAATTVRRRPRRMVARRKRPRRRGRFGTLTMTEGE